MEEQIFDLNHIILYSKNWYKRSENFWDDIYKCLTTTWYINERPHSYMMLQNEKSSMYRVILNKFTEAMHKQPHKLAEFISDLNPNTCWKSGYYTKDYPYYNRERDGELPEYEYEEAVVRVILSKIGLWNKEHFPHLTAPTEECLPFTNEDAIKRFEEMNKK